MLLLSTVPGGLLGSRDGAGVCHSSASPPLCGLPRERGRKGGCPGLATHYRQVQKLGSTSRCCYLLIHILAKPREIHPGSLQKVPHWEAEVKRQEV